MSRALAYWHCGGDICARNWVLTPADAEALHGFHHDEAQAAASAGDRATLDHALNLAQQLSEAAGAAKRWRQASRRYLEHTERSW
jgi:hypothetical protein